MTQNIFNLQIWFGLEVPSWRCPGFRIFSTTKILSNCTYTDKTNLQTILMCRWIQNGIIYPWGWSESRVYPLQNRDLISCRDNKHTDEEYDPILQKGVPLVKIFEQVDVIIRESFFPFITSISFIYSESQNCDTNLIEEHFQNSVVSCKGPLKWMDIWMDGFGV